MGPLLGSTVVARSSVCQPKSLEPKGKKNEKEFADRETRHYISTPWQISARTEEHDALPALAAQGVRRCSRSRPRVRSRRESWRKKGGNWTAILP